MVYRGRPFSNPQHPLIATNDPGAATPPARTVTGETNVFIGQDNRFHEECGVFGIWAPGREVAQLTYFGLFALQHRGQEGCGIATLDGDHQVRYHKGLGLVTEVFNEASLKPLHGNAAIGHVRYSTTGCSSEINTQPIVGYNSHGPIAFAHNGNLSNTECLRRRLSAKGAVFHTTTDTEVVVHLLAQYGGIPLEEALMKAMSELHGSYAFVALNEDGLFAARDPFGNRPLCLGELDEGAYVVASESCALDTVGAKFIRDLEPGEVLIINEKGVKSFTAPIPGSCKAHCVFEYVYFARPDSTLDGVNVDLSRRRMGEILAREIERLDVDIVIPVPDSGTTAAQGFAHAQNHVLTQGILKNRYTGRTFIQPTQALRELMVNLKLNPIEAELKGKRVAVIDDSIVRGTTSRRLVERLREKGATKVHFLVVCPPVRFPCYYGIDTGIRETLIAATHTEEEIRRHIGADSLHFLSLPGLIEAVGGRDEFCTACLNGEYKMGTPDTADE